jgi:3'(2'), 5'-bisphosphate nucleotidase
MGAGQQPGKLDKTDGSPVTIADFGAQAVVCRLIRETFPDDVILAEENTSLLRQSRNSNELAAITRFVREQISSADEESICEWL